MALNAKRWDEILPKFNRFYDLPQRIFTPSYTTGWWFGVVFSALASINEVNLCRARLWDGRPIPSSIPNAGHLFRYVLCDQPAI